MQVKTIRDHGNDHPPVYLKTHGRKYELPDDEARRLIHEGLVEEDAEKGKPSKPPSE